MTTELRQQHKQVLAAGGWRRTSSRGLIEVGGADRASWLHNLTTNVVNTLGAGDGNYAFATNVQGRTLFDLDILVFEDRLWLSVDARWAADALAHLDKYHVIEDVQLSDVSRGWARFEFCGPLAASWVEKLGLGNNFEAFADVQHVAGTVDGAPVVLVKYNWGPLTRGELFLPADRADAVARSIRSAAETLEMIELSDDLATMIRVECGVPASVDDIDHDVIPPETLQIERGISYVKGCYLGQEVIERMRSRGSMARRLTGMKITGDRVPEHNAPVFVDGKEIGRVTTACHSVAAGSILALGYAKVAHVRPDAALQVAISEDAVTEARFVDLPVFGAGA